MTPAPRVRVVGDDILEIPVEDGPSGAALAAHLRTDHRWIDVVPGFESLAVRFDPLMTGLEEAIAALADGAGAAARARAEATEGPIVTLKVRYGGADGPDLDGLAAHAGLTPQEVVARHVGRTYPVALIGFLPGFAYLDGLDPALHIPRKERPRAHVPGGSVGVAGARTGVYPVGGPGGWSILGRAAERLFDPARKPPFLIAPGARVRFEADPVGAVAPATGARG